MKKTNSNTYAEPLMVSNKDALLTNISRRKQINISVKITVK